MKRLLSTIAVFLIACAADAEQYPDRITLGVNDFADIIDAETESRVVAELAEFADDHNIEAVIATLSSLRFYAEDSTIEAYSEGLFNRWAISNAKRNGELMVLMFRDDGKVRVQAGAGYDASAHDRIARVVAKDILPSLRVTGLEIGVNGDLARMIDPPAANRAASACHAAQSSTLYNILGGIAAAIAGLVGLSRYNKAKFAKELCPSCGKTGMQKENVVPIAATVEAQGEGEVRISCPSCAHVTVTSTPPQSYARRSPRAVGRQRAATRQANGSPPRRAWGLNVVRTRTTHAPLLSGRRR